MINSIFPAVALCILCNFPKEKSFLLDVKNNNVYYNKSMVSQKKAPQNLFSYKKLAVVVRSEFKRSILFVIKNAVFNTANNSLQKKTIRIFSTDSVYIEKNKLTKDKQLPYILPAIDNIYNNYVYQGNMRKLSQLGCDQANVFSTVLRL